jgi:hypothetical protein
VTADSEELSLALVPPTGGGEWELHGRLRVRRGTPAVTRVVGVGAERERVHEAVRTASVEALRALAADRAAAG